MDIINFGNNKQPKSTDYLKEKEIILYMDIAIRISEMSYANRKKVGAVLVNDGRILSFGYNGTPAGWDNACEDENGVTKPEVLHGEKNCLLKMIKSNDTTEGSILFVTMAPCVDCASLIALGGIKAVFYKEIYRLTDGLEYLEHMKIPTFQVQ